MLYMYMYMYMLYVFERWRDMTIVPVQSRARILWDRHSTASNSSSLWQLHAHTKTTQNLNSAWTYMNLYIQPGPKPYAKLRDLIVGFDRINPVVYVHTFLVWSFHDVLSKYKALFVEWGTTWHLNLIVGRGHIKIRLSLSLSLSLTHTHTLKLHVVNTHQSRVG